MAAYKEFKERFSCSNLEKYYLDNIQYRNSLGLDRINNRLFKKNLSENIEIISRKVLNGTYECTSYKEILINKGKGVPPRVISIPTIRDKITISVLKEIVFKSFVDEINHKLVQEIIAEIQNSIEHNDSYIKLDIRDFYGSINHELLIKKIGKKIKKKEIIELINKIIKNPTVSEQAPCSDTVGNEKGVPQGLPISNILASIYLNDLDLKYEKKQKIKYFRFVDDILILCNEKEKEKIMKQISNEIKKDYLLIINSEKTTCGRLEDGFTYLGYNISKDKITVKRNSIIKIEKSLESIFSEYKHTNFKKTAFFIWKINMRIIGCIKDNKKYGWIFFFSQINDKELLFHLDWVVEKLLERFKISDKIPPNEIKRFVRAFHEVTYNLQKTNYLYNFDKYSLSEKINFLKDIAEIKTDNFNEDRINYEFNKVIFSSIRDLEKDIQNFS